MFIGTKEVVMSWFDSSWNDDPGIDVAMKAFAAIVLIIVIGLVSIELGEWWDSLQAP